MNHHAHRPRSRHALRWRRAGAGYAFGRDDDGYFESTLERSSTDTVAITTEDITLDADPDSAEWLFDGLDAEIRLRATSADPDQAVFIGIGPRDDVLADLDGVAHDEIVGWRLRYRVPPIPTQ